MTGPIDFDGELDWTAPEAEGAYVLRYEVVANEGTFSDDVVVQVVAAPTGPQTFYPASVPPRARVGEPTFTVAPPEGATPTLLGGNTVLGEAFYLTYAPPPVAGPQTFYPTSVPSRAIVGQPTFTVDPVPEPLVFAPTSIPSRARVAAPSFRIGAAPPDLPVTDLTISLFAVTPFGAAALPDFVQLTLSPVRNSSGSITLEYPVTGRNFSILRDAITGGRDVEVEIWTSGTSRGALRGYLQEASGDDTAESGSWQFGGGFLGLRMDEAVVLPQDPGPLVPDDDDDPDNDKHANEKRELIFNASTPGTVMATAMQLAQAHGWLTDLVWDFTSSHDSEGNPWPQVLSSKFSPGSTYTQLLDRMVALGLAEWDVQWTGAHRVLRMWVPEGRGVDLTTLPVPPVLRHGQNILDAPRKWSVREAGTDVLVAGSEGLYDEASDASAVDRRGRRIARFVSANNLADADAVTAYALNQLPVVTAGLHEVTHGIGFLPGNPRPIATFDVGDWIFSESGKSLERFRVVQWTLSVDADQQMSGTVTLNDTHTDALVRLMARLDAIEAGETVVGTSTPPSGSLDDITPPAAPDGLVVSSIAYQDPAHTNTLASVTVGWLPVVTNADGSNYPAVQAARYIILALEDENPEQEDTLVHEDWTWKDCPQVVQDYNDLLLAEWEADGSPGAGDNAAQIVWLQAYVDAFSATPTATDDVAGYRVRYAYQGLDQVGGIPSSDPFPDDDRVYYEATPANGTSSTSWTFGGVEGGSNLRIEVAAFDRSGNQGPWASIGHDTAVDDTPPPKLGPPGIIGSFKGISISWNGLGQLGEPMPVDFSHIEVWIGRGLDMFPIPSTASLAGPFDPNSTMPQHVASLQAAGSHPVHGAPFGVGYYAALRAVDRSGNVSELSAVSGPAFAEQLFSDALADQIINDPSMIAAQTIGTLHVVDGAIINAKIADLAVNNAKIADLEVGKLRSGTMIAQVTISGKFRTHESDAANRVEFDAAGLRLYRGATVVGSWDVATGNMLITGTWRTGLTGERAEGHPDGSVRFYPQSGINYSQLSNYGNDLVVRGPLDTSGRSGRINVNALGVGMNFSAESEIPNNLRSEVAVFDRRARITSPFIAFEVNGKLSPSDGSARRVQFYQTSSSGTAMPYSYLNYGVSSSSGRGGMWGNGAGWKLEAGSLLVTDDSLNSFGSIKASDFVQSSSREVKRDIRAVVDELDLDDLFDRARSRSFRYKTDPPDAPPRFGVMAEELPAQARRMSPDGKGGAVLSVDLGSQIGLLWAAVNKLMDERRGRA